jgi:hypothetical protein
MVLMNSVRHYDHPMPLIMELGLILYDIFCDDDDVDLLHVEAGRTLPTAIAGHRETNTLTVRWTGNRISIVSSY